MIEMLHCDCMDYMRGLPDKAYDLAIVDPPYGINLVGKNVIKNKVVAQSV
jgi:site-specific DNA-methyltransferase (adenine-specific)